MRVLGLVPARGGSKGVPGKNIRPLGGRPLLAWTAAAARRAESLDRLVLSTDSEEIAAVGREHGLDVPFLRPPELARDDTPTLPVVIDALERLERRGDRFDAVCLLQPTHPFRHPAEIDRAVELLARSGADAVVSVLPLPTRHHPAWAYFQAPDGSLRLALEGPEGAPPPRRQELLPAVHREGSLYLTRRDVVMERGSLYGDRLLGITLSDDPRVDIDTEDDFRAAERLAPDWAARIDPTP